MLGCLTLLQGSLVGPQIDFIKATWFARKHSPDVEDCNLTPRLEASQETRLVSVLSRWMCAP